MSQTVGEDLRNKRKSSSIQHNSGGANSTLFKDSSILGDNSRGILGHIKEEKEEED